MMNTKEDKHLQAQGWLILRNKQTKPINLLMEPAGLSYKMPPGEKFYVFLAEVPGVLPVIDDDDDFLVVHASLAIVYHNGKEIHNLSDMEIAPPDI